MKRILYVIFSVSILFIIFNPIKEEKVINDRTFISLPNRLNNVAINLYNKLPDYKKLETRNKFYFKDNNFYNDRIGLISTNSKKIIDVSSYQKDIEWNKAKNYIDGVILRIGFGNKTEDSKLKQNISEIKKINIPYGIYLYSYAENKQEALDEAKFSEELIKKYDLNPTLGIYYDIEEFYIKGKKVNISKEVYQKIIETYINYLKEYNVSVYTYQKVYKYKLNEHTKKYVTWIAQYNYYFKYEDNFKMWQYTDKESIDGIKGNVDVNVLFN